MGLLQSLIYRSEEHIDNFWLRYLPYQEQMKKAGENVICLIVYMHMETISPWRRFMYDIGIRMNEINSKNQHFTNLKCTYAWAINQ